MTTSALSNTPAIAGWPTDAAAQAPARPERRPAERRAHGATGAVAYAILDSPLGPLLAAAGRRGLVRIAYCHGDPPEAVLASLAEGAAPEVVEAPARLDAVRRQLDEYFFGRRSGFDLPVDLAPVHGLARRVLDATAGIPYGRTESYGAVAARVGSPRAMRAVGNALAANPLPIVVPCHRVVRSSGGFGGYAGGVERKRFLLELEAAARRRG